MKKTPSGRRQFIKGAAIVAAATCIPESSPSTQTESSSPTAYKYPNPGKLVSIKHPGSVKGYDNVDAAIVQTMLDQGLMRFTGINSSPAEALASFFPGLTASKKIAIKPNLINGSVPTRKELVKAVITRLVQMLGGFPAANIFMYDNQNFSGKGYSKSYFGQNVNIVEDWSFPDLGYSIYCDGKDRPYSKTLHDCDYLINMPVMKDHYCGMNFTLSFKNHMGTVNPGGSLGICSNQRAVVDIMADAVMVAKQKLIILDGLYAVIDGGPGGAPGATPTMITISQDPVTTDYFGRKTINQYRTAQGYGAKQGAYIEQASNAPFSIGVANPAEMNISEINLTLGAESPPAAIGWTLSNCYPNPAHGRTEFSIETERDISARIAVFDANGVEVAFLHNGSLSPGFHPFTWNAGAFPAGVYYIRANIDDAPAYRNIILLN
jgi:uncharacterized protein (DUF362 family)